MSDPLDLILRCNQLIIRDRTWNYGLYEDQAKVIDKQITDLLNPKINPGVAERDIREKGIKWISERYRKCEECSTLFSRTCDEHKFWMEKFNISKDELNDFLRGN